MGQKPRTVLEHAKDTSHALQQGRHARHDATDNGFQSVERWDWRAQCGW